MNGPLTITVEPIDAHNWKVASPEVPGWEAIADSPIHLGTHIRDAYGMRTARSRFLARVMIDAEDRGEEAYVCTRCHDIVTRQLRPGRKPTLCPPCRGS